MMVCPTCGAIDQPRDYCRNCGWPMDLDPYDTGCTDECPEDCMADHRGEE